MATIDAPKTGDDSSELAGFGYKQELDRSLGSFSSFAAGFSYISILTGVFELFGFGFLNAGPAVWWSWPIVFVGQMCVALCFAEMAGQFPLAGSVYQWSKRIGADVTSWMTGWILIIGSIVTVDRKSTRLNSSHANISYAVFCLKKKNIKSRLDQSMNA